MLTLTLGPLEAIQAGRYGDVSAAVRDQVEIMRRNQQRLLGVAQVTEYALHPLLEIFAGVDVQSIGGGQRVYDGGGAAHRSGSQRGDPPVVRRAILQMAHQRAFAAAFLAHYQQDLAAEIDEVADQIQAL